MVGWTWVAGQVLVIAVLVALPWRLHTPLAVGIGIVLVITGLLIGIAAFRALGTALTPTPVPIAGAGLRTTGIYAWVRHPIYSAILVALLGMLAIAGTWPGWAWFVVIVAFFWTKSRWEDRLLRETYGAEWEAWAARTWPIIPRPPLRRQ